MLLNLFSYEGLVYLNTSLMLIDNSPSEITGTKIRVILVNVSSFSHSDETPLHRLCGNEWHKRRKRTDEVTERKKEISK